MGASLSREQAALPFAYVRRPIASAATSDTGGAPAATTATAAINPRPAHPLAAAEEAAEQVSAEESSAEDAAAAKAIVAEIDRDGDFVDTLLLLIPQLGAPPGADARCEEARCARDPATATLAFGQLASLSAVGACSQNIVRLSSNIGLLFNATTLQLCCNFLTEIPAEIGYLKNLTSLSVAQNRIKVLPDTIGLLTKLVELKLDHNELTALPTSIGRLSKLVTLSLTHNKITTLPSELGQLSSLVSLDISMNPIEFAPAEIGRLKELRRVNAQGCPLATTPFAGAPAMPSLKELAARTIVRLQLPILSITQPEIKDYLASSHECSYCGGPYFNTFTKYVRIVERSNKLLPLEYRLCVRHWSTEHERVAMLFGPLPSTAPSPIPSVVATPIPTPPGSPESGRHRKGSAAALPLSHITKSPSLPSLPVPADQTGSRKPSSSHILRKTMMIASNMRTSRSLSFLSLPSSTNLP